MWGPIATANTDPHFYLQLHIHISFLINPFILRKLPFLSHMEKFLLLERKLHVYFTFYLLIFFLGDSRLSAAEGNLVNCTWYADNACCRRMEVTSVFGGMFPLYGATTECRSHINYMMCYFCSPDQYRWYDK